MAAQQTAMRSQETRDNTTHKEDREEKQDRQQGRINDCMMSYSYLDS